MAIVNRPMKVMHIISGDLWAGAEVQAFTLLSELSAECELLVVLMNPGELASRLAAVPINLVILDESKLNSLQIVLGLRKQLKQFAPDILHTHRQKENILGNLANKLSAAAASVRTSHGAPEFNAKGLRRIQPWLDAWVGRHWQAAIIAVSRELASQLTTIFPAKNIHIIPNGVNPKALMAAATSADFRLAAPHAIHIGLVGRLEPVKRADIFLAMAALIINHKNNHKNNNENYPHNNDQAKYHFHIIGDGKLKESLIALAAELGITACVTFHGHRTDMAACIASLDALVMCSDHEGTPMTALEALALGTPLVAHNVGGLQDLLQHYPELQVNEHTPAAYARQLTGILSPNVKLNDSDNEIDATPGQQKCTYKVTLPPTYTSAENAKATLALYQSLLGKNS